MAGDRYRLYNSSTFFYLAEFITSSKEAFRAHGTSLICGRLPNPE